VGLEENCVMQQMKIFVDIGSINLVVFLKDHKKIPFHYYFFSFICFCFVCLFFKVYCDVFFSACASPLICFVLFVRRDIFLGKLI